MNAFQRKIINEAMRLEGRKTVQSRAVCLKKRVPTMRIWVAMLMASKQILGKYPHNQVLKELNALY